MQHLFKMGHAPRAEKHERVKVQNFFILSAFLLSPFTGMTSDVSSRFAGNRGPHTTTQGRGGTLKIEVCIF